MKITFLGDILLDNLMSESLEVYYDTNKNMYDFSSLFSNISDYLGKSDYVIANLETPISYDNTELTNVKWQFCSPREFAVAVKKMGVDYVTTANNHCLDRGVDGLESTIRVLDEVGLAHTGTYARGKKREYSIVDICGTKIGILSYTYGTNAKTNHQYLGKKNRRLVDLTQEQESYIDNIFIVDKLTKLFGYSRSLRLCRWLEYKLFPDNQGKQWFEKRTFSFYRKRLLKKDIKSINKKADYSVVCLHIGGQYNKEPSEYTKEMVKSCLNNGANIVIANHEHVVHSHFYSKSNKQFATYAIGNFISSTGVLREPYHIQSEYSVAVNCYFDEGKKVLDSISFSVLKIVEKNGLLTVYPVYDLLKNESSNTESLTNEALLVAQVFSGIQYKSIEEEFVLYG